MPHDQDERHSLEDSKTPLWPRYTAALHPSFFPPPRERVRICQRHSSADSILAESRKIGLPIARIDEGSVAAGTGPKTHAYPISGPPALKTARPGRPKSGRPEGYPGATTSNQDLGGERLIRTLNPHLVETSVDSERAPAHWSGSRNRNDGDLGPTQRHG
jgi:hypothetical protein